MNYYVVGKLKYIIEEIVLLRFRGQNRTEAKQKKKKKSKRIPQFHTNTHKQIEEAVSKLNVTTLNRTKQKDAN